MKITINPDKMTPRQLVIWRASLSITLGVIVGAVVLLILSACGAPVPGPRDDRVAPVDRYSDVSYVEVFRNVDGLPNISMICINGVAFATPTTPRASGEGGTNGGAPLLRINDWDADCIAKEARPR